MECSVCYADVPAGAACKLSCGHSFCNGCIKSWYLKGVNGTACPMCRRPIHFPGFHKVREEWSAEAFETKCAELFGDALDEAFEEAREFAREFPKKWHARIFKEVIDDFIDLDKTLRVLRAYGASLEDIEEVFYYGDYYSDRHLDKWQWADEPEQDFKTRYPGFGLGRVQTGGKRCRALEDEWCTLNFVIEI